MSTGNELNPNNIQLRAANMLKSFGVQPGDSFLQKAVTKKVKPITEKPRLTEDDPETAWYDPTRDPDSPLYIPNQEDFVPNPKDFVKGGEGSKGGKVIGHTKSGKPIYDHLGHSGHKDFSANEHKEAWDAYDKHSKKDKPSDHEESERAHIDKEIEKVERKHKSIKKGWEVDDAFDAIMKSEERPPQESFETELAKEKKMQDQLKIRESKKLKVVENKDPNVRYTHLRNEQGKPEDER